MDSKEEETAVALTSAQWRALHSYALAEVEGRPHRPTRPHVRSTSRTSGEGSRGRVHGGVRYDVMRRLLDAALVEYGKAWNGKPGVVPTAFGRRVLSHAPQAIKREFELSGRAQVNPKALRNKLLR